MTLEGAGDECEGKVVSLDRKLHVTFQGRKPGSWVKVSCEAFEALVQQYNAMVDEVKNATPAVPYVRPRIDDGPWDERNSRRRQGP